MMMKNPFILLAVPAIFIGMYLLGAFVFATFDVVEWEIGGRYFAACLAVIVSMPFVVKYFGE